MEEYNPAAYLISELEDKSEECVPFDLSNIDAFLDKITGCKTVRKVVDTAEVDELDRTLKLIDLYFNSTILWARLAQVFKSITSNYTMDYFKLNENVGVSNDSNI